MTKELEGVYEKGKLRPLEPLAFEENEHLRVTNAARGTLSVDLQPSVPRDEVDQDQRFGLWWQLCRVQRR